MCNSGELGDGFHYLLNCYYFKQERSELLPTDICKNRNIIDYTDLMNSHDKHTLIGLSKHSKIIIIMSVY